MFLLVWACLVLNLLLEETNKLIKFILKLILSLENILMIKILK